MEDDPGKLIDIREREIKSFMARRRPPEEIRDKLDLGYSFENNVLEIYEIRPLWDGTGRKIRSQVAKTRYIKSRGVWKIYWRRASGKWELYEPRQEVQELSEFLRIVDEDEYACFWG